MNLLFLRSFAVLSGSPIETWLIHQVQEALGAPLRVYLNSMVIRGAEPVIVDTGTVANRRAVVG